MVSPVDSGTLEAHAHFISPDGREFFELIQTYIPKNEQFRVHEAFELARHEHGTQRRRSGELFFTHPLTVAYYLAEYHLESFEKQFLTYC